MGAKIRECATQLVILLNHDYTKFSALGYCVDLALERTIFFPDICSTKLNKINRG